MHKRIFSGIDLALDVYSGGHDISIVTFEARNKNFIPGKNYKFGQGFGSGRFAPMEMNEFIVKRSRNHWYQTSEIMAVIELINKMTRGHRLITYGGSMGAFAAINFAPMLNAESFVALSPLFDVSPGNLLNERRWYADWEEAEFFYNFIRSGACRSARGYVFYSENSPDVEHSKLIERETSAILVPLEYGGHPCSFYLNDTYKLKNLISEIASKSFDLNRFYEIIGVRTLDTHYPYERKSIHFDKNGNTTEAIEQICLAIEKSPLLDRLHAKLGELHLKSGRLNESEKAFRAAIDLSPRTSNHYVRISYIFAKRGDFSQAARMMEKAISLKPLKPEYHIRHGEWLLAGGQFLEAERAMMQAIKIFPGAVVAPVRLKVIQDIIRRNSL